METIETKELSELTPTELLKLINDTQKKHEELKKEIIEYTYEIENLETLVNERIKILTILEKSYVDLVELLSNKEIGE
jgi:uncharacterized protein YlxW (UPF0749 family)